MTHIRGQGLYASLNKMYYFRSYLLTYILYVYVKYAMAPSVYIHTYSILDFIIIPFKIYSVYIPCTLRVLNGTDSSSTILLH